MEREYNAYVVQLQPLSPGDARHWILWIQTEPLTGTGWSFDADGFANNWTFRVTSHYSPQLEPRYQGVIKVGVVIQEDIDTLISITKRANAKNYQRRTATGWNCQNWVHEMMDVLGLNTKNLKAKMERLASSS